MGPENFIGNIAFYDFAIATGMGCECLFQCYYPLIRRSVLTRTGRLKSTWLSTIVTSASPLELFTVSFMSNDDTSSRKLTVGWRRIRNETCHTVKS